MDLLIVAFVTFILVAALLLTVIIRREVKDKELLRRDLLRESRHLYLRAYHAGRSHPRRPRK